MKKILLLLFSYYIGLNSIYSQWNLISDTNDSIFYTDMVVQSEDIVFVAGVYRNPNDFVSPLVNGILLRTLDGGITWDTTCFNQTGIYSIFFPSDSIGYAGSISSHVYKTTNKGETWNDLNISWPNLMLAYKMESMFFLNDSVGFISHTVSDGGNYTICTQNGGLSWNFVYNDQGIMYSSNMFFATSNIGYNGMYNKTTDGGITWIYTLDSITYPAHTIDYSINFINEQVGYYCGMAFIYDDGSWAHCGSLTKTIDGAESFTYKYFPFLGIITEIEIVDRKDIYLFGTHNFNNPSELPYHFLKSDYLGENWFFQHHLPEWLDPEIADIDFANSNIGYAVGQNGVIIKTTNAGGELIPIPELSSIAQHYDNNSILISPNPSSDFLKINFEEVIGNADIAIYNCAGKSLLNKNVTGNKEFLLNISDLSSGIYFIRITNDKKLVYSGKFVKE